MLGPLAMNDRFIYYCWIGVFSHCCIVKTVHNIAH